MEIKEHGKKPRKISEGKRDIPPIDRLSALPDSILYHILSFLPTKHSVATSILARRWTFLWTEVPILDFNDKFHSSEKSFAEFINRVLLLHKVQKISSFRLMQVDDRRSDYEVVTWITTAIARNVQNIHLSFCGYHLRLPRCLFTCKTLVELRLDYCSGIPLAGEICLPRLKRLCLEFIDCERDEALSHLLSGCPVLEEFDVSWTNLDLVYCHISSPSMQRLTTSYDLADPSTEDEYGLEINAPALRYLKIFTFLPMYISAAFLPTRISAETLNSLTEVYINIATEEREEDYVGTSIVFDTINKVSNVKCLKLLLGSMELDELAFTDSKFGSSLAKFDNLTKLELAADWRLLGRFLENADNLEVLIIGQNNWSGRVKENLKCWKEPQQVPTCVLSHLTTVIINEFTAKEDEIEMVRYLLKNAKILKKMNIICYFCNSEKRRNTRQRISRFSRGSEACELNFV